MCLWTKTTDSQPKIDMTHPHSDEYLVKYYDGGYDVAQYSNVNRFWSGHITDPHWNCAQFCEVEAWMPIPTYGV